MTRTAPRSAQRRRKGAMNEKGKDAEMNSPHDSKKNHTPEEGRRVPSAAPRSALIADLLRELTRSERLVVALRYTEELTVAEIAAVMELAVIEVERMLESIAERVRRRLAPMYGRTRLA